MNPVAESESPRKKRKLMKGFSMADIGDDKMLRKKTIQLKAAAAKKLIEKPPQFKSREEALKLT
eukprot:CAMPEP_0170506374 /NCGR_PEP_ID=MMETSP0208-20121228/54639_1 /TAXON_ID=197538 /ORGANISM="Strombidium inclinatum, Strain S3" /LENGTH=63 /DNA_ID=CAMNT_0010787851 /DNA_START=41 /DNA_END=232 /DNA_ORIENTATION=+